MPTHEEWLDETVLHTIWNGPLTEDELEACFTTLADSVKKADHTIHLLFNIANSGMIPLQAPTLFLRSRIATLPHMGKIAVFGMNSTGQILGRVASTMTGIEIKFFDDEEHALAYLE